MPNRCDPPRAAFARTCLCAKQANMRPADVSATTRIVRAATSFTMRIALAKKSSAPATRTPRTHAPKEKSRRTCRTAVEFFFSRTRNSSARTHQLRKIAQLLRMRKRSARIDSRRARWKFQWDFPGERAMKIARVRVSALRCRSTRRTHPDRAALRFPRRDCSA
jgi:hypothetical protein